VTGRWKSFLMKCFAKFLEKIGREIVMLEQGSEEQLTPLERMKEMAKIENKKMLANNGGRHSIAGLKGRDGGYSGGRPSKGVNGVPKLSEKAERILVCLKAGMKVKAIAQVVGNSHQAVGQIITRYNLKELADE